MFIANGNVYYPWRQAFLFFNAAGPAPPPAAGANRLPMVGCT